MCSGNAMVRKEDGRGGENDYLIFQFNGSDTVVSQILGIEEEILSVPGILLI